MPKKITVFTTSSCAYCVMVKRYLGAKGQNYEEINLDEHPETPGRSSPNIWRPDRPSDSRYQARRFPRSCRWLQPD